MSEHHVRARFEPVVPLHASEAVSPPAGLLEALAALRDEVDQFDLPVGVPGAEELRAERSRVLRTLDGYLLRRLRDREGPLLVVVGGPTGAGKSTLLNSLVGATLSPSGVLRPTTSSPVLIYNPADGASFLSRRLLPDVASATASGSLLNDREGDRALAMRLVPTDDLPPGLAILDSPDFDSRREEHHALAADLLAVADLWLFVTTSTSYANAVPWAFLQAAAARRVSVAAVLNRVRPEEFSQVRVDLARMLCDEGLEETPLFAIPEAVLIDGLIPSMLIQQLHGWLNHESGNRDARQAYVDRAMDGSLDQVLTSVGLLVQGAADQLAADQRLRVDLRAIFSYAREEIRDRLGTLGPALQPLELAWREYAGSSGSGHGSGSGSGSGGARRPGLWRQLLGGPRPPVENSRRPVVEALEAALLPPFRAEVVAARQRVAERWSGHPVAGSVQLDQAGALPPEFEHQARAAVDAWLEAVGDLALAARSLGASISTDDAPRIDGSRNGSHDEAAREEDDLAPMRADLVARLYALCSQEEARLAALLDAVAASHQTAAPLQAAATAVHHARSHP